MIRSSFLSPFGFQKLEKARKDKDWGEYVGRMYVLVRLIDARPHECFGSPRYEWPEGTLTSPRADLVRACLEWCREILMKEKEYILAARVILSIALPQVRQLVILKKNPTTFEVQTVLAECLSELQLRAFFRWEKSPTNDMGPRLLEWAIRNRKFLHQGTEYIEALQFLYLESGSTSVRQSQVREAHKRFIQNRDDIRTKQAAGLLLPNSGSRKEFSHTEVSVEPLSACVDLELLKLPYLPVEHQEYYESFIK